MPRSEEPLSGVAFARWLLVPALGSLSACLSVALIAMLGPLPADGVTTGPDTHLDVALSADDTRVLADDQPVDFERLVNSRLGATTTAPVVTAPPTSAGGSFVDQGAPAPFGVTSVTSLSGSGIPLRAYKAYLNAQGLMANEQPNCHVNWSLLAGIGRVESNHGRFGGAGFTADGRVSPPIYGVALDGSLAGTAVVRDSDNGAYDGDTRWDRAVGPMQFLPRSWNIHGGDGNADGQRDPQQIDDAVYGSARYMCSGGGDLGTYQGQYAAVYRYNHSDSYVRLVLSLAATYASGQAIALPDAVPAGAHTGAEGPGASPAGEPPGITADAAGTTTSTTAATDPGSAVTLAPTTVTSVIPTTTTTTATSGGTTTTTGTSTSGAATTTTVATTTTTTAPTTTTTRPTTSSTTAAPTTSSTTTTTAAPTTTTTRPSSTATATSSTPTSAATTAVASSTVAPTTTATSGPTTSTSASTDTTGPL